LEAGARMNERWGKRTLDLLKLQPSLVKKLDVQYQIIRDCPILEGYQFMVLCIIKWMLELKNKIPYRTVVFVVLYIKMCMCICTIECCDFNNSI
jgi:hypothetical protein